MNKLLATAFAATLSLSQAAALAQGWSDEHPQPQVTSQSTIDLYSRRGDSPDARDQRSAMERAMERMGPAYAADPPSPQQQKREQKKYRFVMDPETGSPRLEEDTRGDAPLYTGGFGKVDPNQPQQPNGLSPLTPEMLRIPGQGAPGQPGTAMFDQLQGKGFFGGLKPPTKPMEINQEDLVVPNYSQGPNWAKDKIEHKRQFIDGQEHFGNEDPHGFF